MKNGYKLLICSVILLLSSTTVKASEKHWEFAGWYGGGCFPNLAFDLQNKGRVYLTSDVAGIWRSDDLGDHWHFITNGLGQLTVSQVAVAPSDSNVLYAATGGGIFVSKDAGNSWESTDTMGKSITFKRPDNYRPIAIDSQDSNKLCVGTEKGKIFCSNDAGGQWRDIDPNRQFFSDKKPIVALNFDGQNKLMVASDKGLSQCLLDENVCNALNNGPVEVTDFLFSKKTPNSLYVAGDIKLWISKDSGASWSQSEAIPKGKIYRISVDETGDKPVIRVIWNKDWTGGVLLTTDEGQTWEEQDKNLQPDSFSNPTYVWQTKGGKSTSIQIDPFDPNVIFRTDWWGVWRSDDGGATWNEKVVGAPNTVANDILVKSNQDIYVASMDNGLLKSSDGGKKYECFFPQKYSTSTAGHAWRVIPSGNNIIGTSSPWNEIVDQLVISKDDGKTFDLIRSGLPDKRPYNNTMWGQGYPRALAIDPNNPDTIYLGIDGDDGGGLFVSNNKGFTWQRSQGQPDSLRVYHGLAVDPTDSNRIVWGAGGSRAGIYISNDKGKTFQNAMKNIWVFNIIVGPDGAIYVGGAQSGPVLYISNTDKQSFHLLKHFDDKIGDAIDGMAINPSDPKMIAVSTVSWSAKAPCKFYLSHDAGQSWEVINGDLPDGAGASAMTFDPNGQYLYIARYAGSVYKMALQ